MDLLKPMSRLDIFGYLLPGTILIFAGTYILFWALTSLQIPTGSLFDQELLLTVILFVTSYLTGSLLRLFVADEVDEKSSKHLLKVWGKKNQKRMLSAHLSDFEEQRNELTLGNNVPDIPAGFEDWLWRADVFPYSALMNQFWHSGGFQDILNFFQENHRSRMWSESRTARKSFFNYCKLIVIGSDKALADEINISEGLTRFFAGTEAALRFASWALAAEFIVQVLVFATLHFAPSFGITVNHSVNWKLQGSFGAVTSILLLVFQWMRRQIVRNFRRIRRKEAETVYHSFYVHSMRHADRIWRNEQTASRKTQDQLKRLIARWLDSTE